MSGFTMTHAQAADDQSFAGDLWRKLWRRKLLIVLATVVLFCLLFAAWQFIPKSYDATAKLAVDPSQTNLPIQGMVAPTPFDENSLGTETAILKSVLPQVLVQMHLVDVPEFNPDLAPPLSSKVASALPWLAPYTTPLLKWADAIDAKWISGVPQSATSQEQQVADTLATLVTKVKFTPEPRSRVIDVTVRSRDNQLAANIANGIVAADLAVHRKYVNSTNIAAHTIFDDHLVGLRKAANEAAMKVEQYRAMHGLAAGKTATMIQEESSNVNEQLAKAQANLDQLKAEWGAVRTGDPSTLAAVLGSQTIALLKEEKAKIEVKRAQLMDTYGARSDVLRSSNAQLANIDGQIRAEANRARTSLQNQMRAAEATVASLQNQMQRLSGELKTLTEARGDLSTLEAAAEQARTDYRQYAEAGTRTKVAMLFTIIPVRQIETAVPPTRPAFPNIIDYGATGILSLLAAGAMALGLESRRKGLTSTVEVRSLTQLPALAMLPYRTNKTEQMFHDGIQTLLNRLTDLGTPMKVLITSAKPHEGKSTIALALTEAAAARGFHALMIDADLRKIVTSGHGRAAACGLGDVLRGEIGIGQALMRPASGKELAMTPSIAIIPAGKARGNPSNLLAMRGDNGKTRIQTSLDALIPSGDGQIADGKTKFDFVVIDCPPAFVGGDCWTLSKCADVTVVVAKWGETTAPEVQLVVDELTSARSDKPGAMVAGVVLNMVYPDNCARYGGTDAIRFDRKMYNAYYRRNRIQ